MLRTLLFCYRSFEWNYLSFRFCIGIWIGIILIVLVAADASAFVCYITRFTEENFATLIAFIFIKKSFDKVAHIGDHAPLHKTPCFCFNQTYADSPDTESIATSMYTDGETQHFANNTQFTKIHVNFTKKHQHHCEVHQVELNNLLK